MWVVHPVQGLTDFQWADDLDVHSVPIRLTATCTREAQSRRTQFSWTEAHNLVQVPLTRSVGESQKGNECEVTCTSFQINLRREEGRIMEIEGTLWFYKYE